MPVSAPPTVLDECLFFISLVSDFFAFGFSVSSGCARRRSVSAYTAILVLSSALILDELFSPHLERNFDLSLPSLAFNMGALS